MQLTPVPCLHPHLSQTVTLQNKRTDFAVAKQRSETMQADIVLLRASLTQEYANLASSAIRSAEAATEAAIRREQAAVAAARVVEAIRVRGAEGCEARTRKELIADHRQALDKIGLREAEMLSQGLAASASQSVFRKEVEVKNASLAERERAVKARERNATLVRPQLCWQNLF